MARSQASNLSGMLGSIGDTLGKMGDTGNQYVDSFRRLQAPKADMNDSASLSAYAQWAKRNGYDDEATRYDRMAYDAADRERQTEEKLAVQRGRSEIADIQNQMTQLFLDPKITDEARTQELAQLQQKINGIARNTPNMDPNAYASIGQNIDQFYTERKRAEAADRREDARLEAMETRLGLEQGADARATERHRQLMQSGELQIEAARTTAEVNKLTLASKLASAYVGQEGGKEAFLSREGMEEYGGLFDQMQMQYDTNQAELDAARAALRENAPFDYSQEALEEMLYLMPDPVAAAKQLRELANGGPPSAAHQQLIAMLNSQSRTNKVPDATLLKLFNNMAQGRLEAEKSGTAAGPYAYQDTTSWFWESSEGDETQALSQISAAMLNAYLAAPNPQQGIADVQLILTHGLNGTGDDESDGTPKASDEMTIEEMAAALGISADG